MTTDPFSTPSSPTVSSLLARLDDVSQEADGFTASCPAHPDSHASLRVAWSASTRNLLIKCRAACETESVLAALDMNMSQLFDVAPGDLTSVVTAHSDTAAPGIADTAALKTYLSRAAAALPGSPALTYATARFGVTPEQADQLGLGFDDTTSLTSGNLKLSGAMYRDTPRLVVPFLDFDSRPGYLQARALAGEPRAKWSGPANPEGAAWAKFGVFNGGAGWTECFITEGPGDALTACAVGYDAVAIRGAGLGANAALADLLAVKLAGRRVIVAGDSDTAGQKFTTDVSSALSSRGLNVSRLLIPADAGSDLTDWRKHLGPTAFPRALVSAVSAAPRYGSDEITSESIGQDVTRMFSDVYNAETLLRIIREHGADIRHTAAVGFVIYDPNVGTWATDAEEWVRRQAHKVAVRVQKTILAEMAALDAKVAAIEDTTIRDRTGKVLDMQRAKARSGKLISYVESSMGINNMTRELRALAGIAANIEDFDQHPHLLAVRNGVVDLETGTLRPYSTDTKPLYLMRRVELDYRADARCPRWEEFLTEIFAGQPSLPGYAQRLVGYGVTGLTSEQCFGVLWGTGANGKSVFTETLSAVFRGITTTTSFATFESKPGGGIRNDLAALKGARLVITSEGEQGKAMDEAAIKRLTGQDSIDARFLYKETFEFKPTFLILMASNYRPNFRGQDEGLWRRVKLIPFARYFSRSERDHYLVQKFTGQHVPRTAYRAGEDYGDAAAGILAWAVAGARAWYATGLDDPPVVETATQDYRESSDALAGFYAEHLVREPAGRIAGKDVWGLYLEWADDEGLPPKERWTRKTFWAALEERGATKTVPGGSVSFRGIRRVRPSELAGLDLPRAGDPALSHLAPEPTDPF